MNIYFSGIMGMGIGPLAILSAKVGHQIFGSDQKTSLMQKPLADVGATIQIGPQDGKFLTQIAQTHSIDWFVHTSAVKKDHPELLAAQKLELKITKRDTLINQIITEKQLKLLAVAGTHGKTTTTSMLIWCFQQLGLPLAYLTGTTLSFAPPADCQPNSQFFVYETDEFDRNFLAFHPYLALIPSVDYDHPDIYPTKADYDAAFAQFRSQSQTVLEGGEVNPQITLLGEHNRQNAALVYNALMRLFNNTSHLSNNANFGDIKGGSATEVSIFGEKVIQALNTFPGAMRRFEQIAPNIYSDYAHHPKEIHATLQLARERAAQIAAETGQTPQIIAIYEPHQNARQQLVLHDYPWAFEQADQILWLPTELSREPEGTQPIPPEFFTEMLQKSGKAAKTATKNPKLLAQIHDLAQNNLVVLLSDTSLDPFVRQNLPKSA
ncbi:MAG: Mur ligase domain-containing protein [Candidatus Nomurabacteria bacterium]|jgi:UDP-N-acetylmuramate--alanine ligase|nr:Mur ligase domain-containing protein [Candidatus Nomurabacteria bacterium]